MIETKTNQKTENFLKFAPIVLKIANKYSPPELKQDCISIGYETVLHASELWYQKNQKDQKSQFNYIFSAVKNNIIKFLQKQARYSYLDDNNTNININDGDDGNYYNNTINFEELSWEIANNPYAFSSLTSFSEYTISSIRDPLKLIEIEEKREILHNIITEILKKLDEAEQKIVRAFLEDDPNTNSDNNNNKRLKLHYPLKRKLKKLLSPYKHIII